MLIPQFLALIIVLGSVLLLAGGRKLFVCLLIAILLLQNIIIMLSLRFEWVGYADAPKLFFAKELLILAGVAIVAVRSLIQRRGVLSRTEFWILVLGVYLLIILALNRDVPLMFQLAEARSIVLLPLVYVLGIRLGIGLDAAQFVRRILITLGVLLAGFGFVERLILDEGFWLGVGHIEYYWMREQRVPESTLYGNMYFWDMGQPVRRMASIVGDPLMAGGLLVMVSVCAIALGWFTRRGTVRRETYRFLVVFVFVPALLLTLSRSALLGLAFGCVLLVLARSQPRLFGIVVKVALIAGIMGVLVLGELMLNHMTGQSHVVGLREGLHGLAQHPLGRGLGTTGTLADVLFDTHSGYSVGLGDSFVGSVAYQLGVPGLFLFFMVHYSIVRQVFRCGRHLQDVDEVGRWLCTALAAVLAGLLLASPVSGSVYSLVGSGTTFLLAGMMTSYVMVRLPDARVTKVDGPAQLEDQRDKSAWPVAG
ncbi:MAG: hypothetical protein JJU36_14535 [Phycisphaeraceae bacterium]|nr:hypothetical protein [Phycisphaeraceae bacterium]